MLVKRDIFYNAALFNSQEHMTFANVNGVLLPSKEAYISIHDRGFRFGDGVFETIALHNGVPYQYDWHMNRLARGLDALKISFDLSILQPFCRQLLHKNASRTGALRIQITRGCGSRGYLPEPEKSTGNPSFVIETTTAAQPPLQGLSLWMCSYKKISLHALPVNFKICQGLNSVLARMEAQANGCFEALLLNEKNQLCETSSATIFWIKDHKLYTPALSSGPLEGSTRAALIRLFDISEIEAGLEDILEASSVFLANSGWGVLPVTMLQPSGHTWSDITTVQPLQRKLLEDRDRDARQNAHKWLIQ